MTLDMFLEYNRNFVEKKEFLAYETEKYPNLKVAILSCMDTRLTHLLVEAIGIKNGDAKLIKNAGAVICHPWGSAMRSLILAVYELDVEEIFVIAHHDCGLRGMSSRAIIDKALERGITKESLHLLENAGISIDQWLTGFEYVEESVMNTVKIIKRHPLMPPRIPIHGLVIHPKTGELTVICRDVMRE